MRDCTSPMQPNSIDLSNVLHQTFGFPAFRPNQESVCRAATEGRDVLLVMPTGAGKSLCYQLPAVARGGTALVISPLIALMDDQAAKLTAVGLRVARIHSGLDRDASRQACRDYLDGTLQFLFIAPERLRVPGFPEMLAKRKPALIAIDEAHCISAWGHDFRPDYRLLGDYLPSLRPSPIIALTATATPAVQSDIVAQLQLRQPELFIHGFRRDNLHIEVVEMSKPRRYEFAVDLLGRPGSRPAIVYAPSRKAAEELAAMLGPRAAAYHAGLEPSVRERVQQTFQSGKLEVVVATIAFGMGIDKADVRTVVHIALPASVEAYYQEIGRAGRDGVPSKTVLLHSFVDRKIHEGFLERDYPPAADLTRVLNALTGDFDPPEAHAAQLRMSRDIFAKCIEKLAAQGAAQIDFSGNVRRAPAPPANWQSNYEAQVAFRRSQIDRMAAFAETSQCRMSALVRHFGDTADGMKPCGHCDFCAPGSATAQSFRAPDRDDLRHLLAILAALQGNGRSTGKLHTELAAGALRGTPAATNRRAFDSLLDALTRAGLITIASEQWTNPAGDLIHFKKAALTHEGREAASTGNIHLPDLRLADAASTPAPAKSARRKARSASSARKTGTPSLNSETWAGPPPDSIAPPRRNSELSSELTVKLRRPVREESPVESLTPAQQLLDQRLRDWRKSESEKLGLPQFFVLGSSTLRSIVLTHPRTLAQLQTISGIGPEKAQRYGPGILEACNEPA